MKRLYLTVEGQTEQAFALGVLQAHLTNFNVFLVKPRLTGLHSRRQGRIPKGGLLDTFQHALEDMRRWMLEDKSCDARFSMMVDLYSLPSDFPGYEEAVVLADPHEQARHLESSLSEVLSDSRFVPYVQVHEFEALILANVDCLKEWFDNVEKEVEKLKEECAAFQTPEHINHGSETHPKARIEKYIADYHNNVDGPALAEYVGVEAIRERCPHFSAWIRVLEQLDAGDH